MEDDKKNGQTINKPQKGKSWIIVILTFLLVVAGVGGYFVFSGKLQKDNKKITGISWTMTDDGNYQPSDTPPDCPSPLILEPPTDLSRVVSILYPGQIRGGDYKPHGGLRFADGANDAVITAPMDASVIDGSRYLESGEVQYLFDFVNSCGIKYRFDHLRTLSAPFVALAEKFPEAKDNDSRTTLINSPMEIKAGETIATAVGFFNSGNAGFDFGVYDLRKFNDVSENTTFREANADDRDQAWHALCWFDLFLSSDEATVRNIPATANNSQSDYCK